MYRQIPREPLRPRAFPFGKQREGPLYRPEYRQHPQQDLLAVYRSPPPDTEYHEGDEHDDFVDAHDDAGGQRGEPQLGRVLLHAGHFVHAGLFHRGFYQVRVGRAGMGHVSLCLQAGVHRVAHEDEFLRFLELVADLRGFRLVEVVGVRADAVGDVGQEVQEAPVAAAACHARVCRRVPPAQHKRHGQRPEQLHHVQRLVLDHHLVGHARRHDDGEQGGERHAHLQYPPVTTNYCRWVKT